RGQHHQPAHVRAAASDNAMNTVLTGSTALADGLGLPCGGVPRHDFLGEMTSHWRTLGNKQSPALRSVWATICDTLNPQLGRYGEATTRTWRVLPAETRGGQERGREALLGDVADRG